jgi:malate/lactate dehydrogenase
LCLVTSHETCRYQKELALYNAEIVGNKKRLTSAIATAAAARGEAESRDNESAVCFATESYMAGGEDEPWEVKNAVRLATPFIVTSLIKYPLTFVQRNLIRESEKMVRDTAARLERATEELSNFVVR